MFSSKRCLEWFYEYAGEHLLDTLLVSLHLTSSQCIHGKLLLLTFVYHE